MGAWNAPPHPSTGLYRITKQYNTHTFRAITKKVAISMTYSYIVTGGELWELDWISGYRSPIIPGDIPEVRIRKSEGRDDCPVSQKRVFRGATRYRIDPRAGEGANHNVFKVSVIRVQIGNFSLQLSCQGRKLSRTCSLLSTTPITLFRKTSTTIMSYSISTYTEQDSFRERNL